MIQRQTQARVESPSLAARSQKGARAYELKFLVAEALAREIASWAAERASMAPDPHAGASADEPGTYRTTTLYLDTPAGDVFHRAPGYRRRKFRVRRYGAAPTVFVERKRKNEDRVSKRRTEVGVESLAALGEASAPETWEAHWFHRVITRKGLRPTARIAYKRTALVGTGAEGPLRLTMDRDIRGETADGWSMAPVNAVGSGPLLPGRVVLELKFMSGLPLVFKQLIEAYSLRPAVVSKYRVWRGGGQGEPDGHVHPA